MNAEGSDNDDDESGAPSGDSGGWRTKRKGTFAEQKKDQKKEQKRALSESDLFKEFRDKFSGEIKTLVITEGKVLVRMTNPIPYLKAQKDLFYRIAAWFTMDAHEDFVLNTLQRNKEMINAFRKILLPLEERFQRLGFDYYPERKMLKKNLLMGVLQADSSRGGTHDTRAYDKWRELKTWVLVEDKETGRNLLGRPPKAAAPAAAAGAASSSSSAGAGPSGSGQQSAVTDELQKALDEYDEQMDAIKKHIARLEADDADPKLPVLVDAKLSLELVEAQKELLLAKRVEERAIDALKHTQPPSMQLFTDKSKAENAVLDLELKIIELKQKLNV